jgi:hypothetical protein
MKWNVTANKQYFLQIPIILVKLKLIYHNFFASSAFLRFFNLEAIFILNENTSSIQPEVII